MTDIKTCLACTGQFCLHDAPGAPDFCPGEALSEETIQKVRALYEDEENKRVSIISAQVEAVQNGQQITGTSDPLDSATCEMSLDYTVRFYVLAKEYDVDYRASLEIPYSESSRYYLTEGSKIDLYYNPIFPSNFKLIF